MKSAIHVGGANPESVNKLAETVLQILQVPHTDERTKQLALEVIGKGVEAPSNLTISSCNFEMPETIVNNDFQQSRIDTINTMEQEDERTKASEEDS